VRLAGGERTSELDLIAPHALGEGDVVALRTGAPVSAYPWLQPGVEGRVIIADDPAARYQPAKLR
jgi:hypothetical protein